MNGKGAVEGIGAIVKRSVWTQIKSRQKTIKNAEEFSLCFSERFAHVKIFYKDKEDINNSRKQLAFSHISRIPNLQFHHFIEASEKNMQSRITYKSTKFTKTKYLNYMNLY